MTREPEGAPRPYRGDDEPMTEECYADSLPSPAPVPEYVARAVARRDRSTGRETAMGTGDAMADEGPELVMVRPEALEAADRLAYAWEQMMLRVNRGEPPNYPAVGMFVGDFRRARGTETGGDR